MIRGYVWPEIWVRHVILPTVRTYHDAKRKLIDGLKLMRKEVDFLGIDPKAPGAS